MNISSEISITNEYIALTSSNHIVRLNLETGKFIQATRLSSSFKFKYLNWDKPQDTFFATSTNASSGSIAIVVFSVVPFRLVAKFVCRKEVFGKNMTQICVWESCLVVMSSASGQNEISFYNLDSIIREFGVLDPASVVLGNPNADLPDTLDITEFPEPIFQNLTHLYQLDFGAVPFHFVWSNKFNEFKVSDLMSQNMVSYCLYYSRVPFSIKTMK